MSTVVVLARNYRQYEAFVCDMCDEGMLTTDFAYASHFEVLKGYQQHHTVVKLEDCYEDKAESIVNAYEDLLLTMRNPIYTESGFKLEQRRILK